MSGHSSLLPAPGQQETALRLCGCAHSARFGSMKSHITWPFCLTSFTWHKVFKTHPRCSVNLHFIPLLAEYHSIPWISPYFIYSLTVIGHLGYFNFGAIINDAPINMHVQVLYKYIISTLLGIYLGVEELGHMVTLHLSFLGTANCFPKSAHHFPIPTASRV